MTSLSKNDSPLDTFAVQRILYAVRQGERSKTMIAEYAGISPSTLGVWLQKGRLGLPVYKDFFSSYKKAEASTRIEALEAIKGAFHKDWKSAAWYLEKTDPLNFGQQQHDMKNISLLLFELALMLLQKRTTAEALREEFPAIADQVINMVENSDTDEKVLSAEEIEAQVQNMEYDIILEGEAQVIAISNDDDDEEEIVKNGKVQRVRNKKIVDSPETLSDDTKAILTSLWDQ